jgi:phytanoyl-CoA hydroxylase
METTTTPLTDDELRAFADDGYLVVRGLLTRSDVDVLIDRFMAIHAAGPVQGYFEPKPVEPGGDVLAAYPRIMHPHRFDDVARRHLLDRRLASVLQALFGEEPLAAQSMLYFKPPGARGQALHQDNFFLRVEPGTCIAAWVALDRSDAENGGLEVVPGTHRMDVFCPEEADLDVSFTREYVPVPEGLEAVPLILDPGDVLFFNGSMVHGSTPNRSRDRFRRSFICHYIGRSSERVSRYYRPILTMNGEEVLIDESTTGGPCGTAEASAPH